MKVNLGGGRKNLGEGWTLVDFNPSVNPDYCIDLNNANIKLPFEDNSVEEVAAHHILEHLDVGFIPLMIEIYRVCKPGAIVDVIVPHHHHEVYFGDPTHVRPITVTMMSLFDKNLMEANPSADGEPSDSSLAHRYNVNFETIWYDFDYDPFYIPMIERVFQLKEQNMLSPDDAFTFERLMREANNVATNTKIKLQVIK